MSDPTCRGIGSQMTEVDSDRKHSKGCRSDLARARWSCRSSSRSLKFASLELRLASLSDSMIDSEERSISHWRPGSPLPVSFALPPRGVTPAPRSRTCGPRPTTAHRSTRSKIHARTIRHAPPARHMVVASACLSVGNRYLGARLARMRCSVRRCMLRRRAVSDTLRPHSS